MSNRILASLSALALTLGLAQGMAHAELNDAEATMAFKALLNRVTTAQKIVGASEAARFSMLRQIRAARARLGPISRVDVKDQETAIHGSAGEINLTLPDLASRGGARGYLRTSVRMPAAEGAPHQQVHSMHEINTNGVVQRTVSVNAFTADGNRHLGQLRSAQHGFPSAALSPSRR
jgi:hypothetical protein